MKNPAPIVKFVIESVCVMKGILPKRCVVNIIYREEIQIESNIIRKPDLENKGKLVDDYWSPGQQVAIIINILFFIIIIILIPTLTILILIIIL